MQFLEKKFEEYFEKDDFKDRIEKLDIQRKFGRIIITGTNWKSCEFLFKKYSKKPFMDTTIKMELFRSKEPTAAAVAAPP